MPKPKTRARGSFVALAEYWLQFLNTIKYFGSAVPYQFSNWLIVPKFSYIYEWQMAWIPTVFYRTSWHRAVHYWLVEGFWLRKIGIRLTPTSKQWNLGWPVGMPTCRPMGAQELFWGADFSRAGLPVYCSAIWRQDGFCCTWFIKTQKLHSKELDLARGVSGSWRHENVTLIPISVSSVDDLLEEDGTHAGLTQLRSAGLLLGKFSDSEKNLTRRRWRRWKRADLRRRLQIQIIHLWHRYYRACCCYEWLVSDFYGIDGRQRQSNFTLVCLHHNNLLIQVNIKI